MKIKPIDTNEKNFILFPKLKNKRPGNINKVITIKLKQNKPNIFRICNISVDHEKL